MSKIVEILERWAEKYKPMKHDNSKGSKNRRVYFCDGDTGFRDMLQHVLPEHSPFVMIDSELSGTVSPQSTVEYLNIFFVVRCSEMASDKSLYSGNEEAKLHMRRFFAYLLRKSEGQEWRRLIGLDSIQYQSYHIGFDGWTSVMITIKNVEPTDLCADEGYMEE